MLKEVRLPAWLEIECRQESEDLLIIHTLTAGFNGYGKILDSLIKIYLSEDFCGEVDEHAQSEFSRLAKLLIKRGEVVI